LKELEPANPSWPVRKKLIIQRKDAPRFVYGCVVEVAGIKMVVQGYSGENHLRSGGNDNVISEVRVEMLKPGE
jgi:hypothetical protein